MLDDLSHDEPSALAILQDAIENYIDAVEDELWKRGLYAERDRIRDRLFDPANRHMLIPDA